MLEIIVLILILIPLIILINEQIDKSFKKMQRIICENLIH